MSDIGRIPVPEIAPVGTFPLVSDYPHETAIAPRVITHRFGSSSAKVEQRFWSGNGARRWSVRRSRLSDGDASALLAFWDSRKGPYEPFTYNAPGDAHADPTTAVTARFADDALTLEYLQDAISSFGLELIEVPTTAPTYALNATEERFPSAALQTALLEQVQTVIPLVYIKVGEVGHPDNVFLSDRRVTVGSQEYLERLLEWNGISQALGGQADQANFRFGNADRVMTLLANDTNLDHARVEFSLFHVQTGTKLDLWAGYVTDWQADAGPEFRLSAADPLEALNLPYPRRTISRTCWKTFDDGVNCPYTAEGSGGDPASCDKGFATANGCQAHGMAPRHGGIAAKLTKVRIKDNSRRRFGFGAPTITSSSIPAETAYGQVIPEIFTDTDWTVNARIVDGLDESEFYRALAVVGEGPIGAYAASSGQGPHKLDEQPHHGATESPPTENGLGKSLGADPNNDPFGLGTSPTERAAGTAHIDIRRQDQKGIQASESAEHSMNVVVAEGRSGFIWTAPGVRTTGVLTNAFWISINSYLRVLQLENASVADQEAAFDVQAAIDTAAIAELLVDRIIGSGQVKQYQFRGVLEEQKPFRDWLTEILTNAMGYWSFANGKLRLGIRNNSSVLEAFTAGNMIWRSLQPALARPAFNHLTAHFADEELEVNKANSVPVYDVDHAKFLGGPASPQYLTGQLNLVGTFTKDQAGRIATTRLREELGGINEAQWKARRRVTFQTTVLGLNAEPGMVISVTDPDMPGGAGEMRVQSIRFNPDFSIAIEGLTTVDEIYDLTVGPKPDDVPADPVPGDTDAQLRNVTNFAASESPFVQEDGTIVSRVSFSFDDPVPDGIFGGVNIYLQELDGQGGTPVEEPKLVSFVPQESSPSQRRFDHPVLKKWARLTAQSVADNNVKANPIGASPTTEVLLDGVTSAPVAVDQLWCQVQLDGGLQLSWREGAATDLAGYKIGTTGDIAAALDAHITEVHVVDTHPAVRDAKAHAIWRFTEPEFEGDSDGTTLTVSTDPNALTFNVDGGNQQMLVNAVGRLVTIITTDGGESEHQAVSNTTGAITFAASSIPTGRVKFRLRGLNGQYNFYVAPFNTSNLQGPWKPIPPATLPCVPLDRLGTKDQGLTTLVWTGLITNPGAFWKVAPQADPGGFGLYLECISQTEAETDFATANKLNLNSILAYQFEVTHSKDGGVLELTTELLDPMPAATAEETYRHLEFPPGNPIWVHRNTFRLIPFASRAIHQIRGRVQNSRGWGPWIVLGHFGPGTPSNPPFFTGQAPLEEADVKSAATGTLYPNVALATDTTYKLTGDITVKPPELLSSSGTPGTGSAALEGQKWGVRAVNPGAIPAGGYKVTFDPAASFVGLDGKGFDGRANRYTYWEFRIEGAKSICINYLTGAEV